MVGSGNRGTVGNLVVSIGQRGAVIYLRVGSGLDGQRTLADRQSTVHQVRIVSLSHAGGTMEDGNDSRNVIGSTHKGTGASHIHGEHVTVREFIDTIGTHIHIVVRFAKRVGQGIAISGQGSAIIRLVVAISRNGDSDGLTVFDLKVARLKSDEVVSGHIILVGGTDLDAASGDIDRIVTHEGTSAGQGNRAYSLIIGEAVARDGVVRSGRLGVGMLSTVIVHRCTVGGEGDRAFGNAQCTFRLGHIAVEVSIL